METKEDAPRCDGSTPKKPAHSENIMVMNRIERKKSAPTESVPCPERLMQTDAS